MKPLAIDLYCGLGGWAEGFLSEGYRVVGFDIEAWPYPGLLVLQDVLTLHGSQFRDAAVIVGSSPCQEFSYRAMPWKRAKALPPPELGIKLFQAQFRIQREASEAAGRYIPLVVENVKGAQPWVGRAAWHYGSYYLWGDVPALMPSTLKLAAVKVSGLNWSGSDKPGYVAKAFNSTAQARMAQKNNGGDGFDHTRHFTNQRESDAVKQHGSGPAWFDKALEERRKEATAVKGGGDWFSSGDNCSVQRRQSSGSTARKAASALIAKIPFDLASHIARTFKPVSSESEKLPSRGLIGLN